MTVTPDSFRTDYPEFADKIVYPDSSITRFVTLAGLMLNVSRWDTLLGYGTELFVAHNLALQKQARDTASRNNGTPGRSTGAISNKSVGPVSVSYDTGAGIVMDAGHWNLTEYGIEFVQIARQIGAGPVTTGGCWPGPGSFSGGWT